MAKQLEKERALQFRRGGLSINEIARILSVSKSTVSYWCRDIELNKRQINALARRSKHHATEALLRSAEKQRCTRIHRTTAIAAEGAAEIGHLSKRDLFMVGIGLYWGEGYKSGSQELGFTNSDAAMIRFYIQWLREIYGIGKKDLILRISINAIHENRLAEVTTYWEHNTKVPRTQFTKPSLIKTLPKKSYGNDKKHYGTLRVKVRKGTMLRRKILGSISALQKT